MVTEDFVSFETAKLLKEKGFDEPCLSYFWSEGIDTSYTETPFTQNNMYEGQILRPTLQMAMKWLRETHNLHIGVLVTYQYLPRKYEVHVMHTEKCEGIVVHPGTNFNTNEQACEAAIKYCLENLV